MSGTPKNSASGSLPVLAVVSVIGLLVVGFIYGRGYFGKPSIASLKESALNGSSAEQQISAAQQLSELGAVDALREVLEKTTNPDVSAVCILGVARQRDYDSMDLLLAKLDDNSENVRATAASALTKLLGRKYHFPASGRADERAAIKEQIVQDWNDYNGSELFEFNKNRFKEEQ